MKNLTVYFLLAVLIGACNSKHHEEIEFSNAVMDQASVIEPMAGRNSDPLSSSGESNKNSSKKKIIRNGRMGIRVEDLEQSRIRINTMVKAYNGYFANERYNNTDDESTYNLKIRIPAADFEKFITEFEIDAGEILYKEISANDVTDQFIDLETRLKNKHNYLSRYNELLKKAKSVKDIMEIEEKIRVLQEEIESTEGRLKYLGDQVAYSTLDLMITRKNEFRFRPGERDDFIERLKQSVSRGWFGFIDFLVFLIRIWPVWVIAIPVILFIRRIRRKRKRKEINQKQNSS